MDIADQDIGGAHVRRRFTRGEQALIAGHMLTGDEVRAIPHANRRALISAGYIAVYPQAPLTSIGGLHVVSLGKGQYDVIRGVKLNDKPLSKDDAEDLATRPSA